MKSRVPYYLTLALFAVACGQYSKLAVLEVVAQHAEHGRVVFDDQNCFRCHRFNLPYSSPAAASGSAADRVTVNVLPRPG